jgi:hypothetical protein
MRVAEFRMSNLKVRNWGTATFLAWNSDIDLVVCNLVELQKWGLKLQVPTFGYVFLLSAAVSHCLPPVGSMCVLSAYCGKLVCTVLLWTACIFCLPPVDSFWTLSACDLSLPPVAVCFAFCLPNVDSLSALASWHSQLVRCVYLLWTACLCLPPG